jgi:glyoxylase-like metal-dependent hydrolase (beta-lactamase superfamily II)
MESVIPDLYASDSSPLPFAPSDGIRAFLLRRDAGNVLIYSSPGVDADAVAALGGVSQVLLGHWHEAEFGGGAEVSAALDAPLAGERAAPIELAGDDLEVVPIPGHTPGATAYLWNGALFPGDSIMLRGDDWVGAVLESSDRAAYVASLERMRELDFELLIPWAARLDGPFAVATDRADTRRRLDAIVARVRAGEDG